jgi:hypothetical protein
MYVEIEARHNEFTYFGRPMFWTRMQSGSVIDHKKKEVLKTVKMKVNRACCTRKLLIIGNVNVWTFTFFAAIFRRLLNCSLFRKLDRPGTAVRRISMSISSTGNTVVDSEDKVNRRVFFLSLYLGAFSAAFMGKVNFERSLNVGGSKLHNSS